MQEIMELTGMKKKDDPGVSLCYAVLDNLLTVFLGP
jgi:hypothetical protein